MPLRVFLSHSERDLGVVQFIAQTLQSFGISVYLAEYDPRPGERLSDKLVAAIRECDCFLVVLTPQSQVSPIVQQEIGIAIGAGKRVIALVQRMLEPRALGLLQGVEYIEFDPYYPGNALEKLIHSLQEAAQSKDANRIAASAVAGLALLMILALGKGGGGKAA